MKLFKTTITILSEYDPHAIGLALDDLVTDALEGESYPPGSTVEEIDCADLEGEGVKEFFNCTDEKTSIELCEEHGVQLVEAQEPEIVGMWDWLAENGNACDMSFPTEVEAAADAVKVLGLRELAK